MGSACQRKFQQQSITDEEGLTGKIWVNFITADILVSLKVMIKPYILSELMIYYQAESDALNGKSLNQWLDKVPHSKYPTKSTNTANKCFSTAEVTYDMQTINSDFGKIIKQTL